MRIHVVKKGDYLWKLSQLYNVGIDEIIEVNELAEPELLLVGQSLVIPTPSLFYTVRPGETLWSISQKFETTVDNLVVLNQISKPAVIYPGTILRIPQRLHTVKAGETLWQIARRYDITLRNLLKANKLDNPDLIYPGLVLNIPQAKPPLEVNAYTYYPGEQGARLVQEAGEHLTCLSPFAYVVQADGNLRPFNDNALIDISYQEKIAPMLSITNFTYQAMGSETAHAILTNQEMQDNLLTNISTVMKNNGYLGLNIYFENVFPEDRQLYNQFIQRAVERLHPENYFVSTALAPKTSGGQKGLLYEAHDYPAHGQIADFVILMTYEWGYRLGPPQAISPLNQIKRVLDYAVSVMPSSKIFMGFQLYARDWTLPFAKGNEAETFSPQKAITQAIRYRVDIKYDNLAQSPYYNYRDEEGREHQVWFEDARSAQTKFDTVKEYKLRGISYWVLGYPYPQNWTLLEDNFEAVKYL